MIFPLKDTWQRNKPSQKISEINRERCSCLGVNSIVSNAEGFPRKIKYIFIGSTVVEYLDYNGNTFLKTFLTEGTQEQKMDENILYEVKSTLEKTEH